MCTCVRNFHLQLDYAHLTEKVSGHCHYKKSFGKNGEIKQRILTAAE